MKGARLTPGETKSLLYQEKWLSVVEAMKISPILCLPIYLSSDPQSPQLSSFHGPLMPLTAQVANMGK